MSDGAGNVVAPAASPPVDAGTEGAGTPERLASLQPKLAYLLEERGITSEVRALIVGDGITTIAMYARVGRDERDFSELLEELGIRRQQPGGRSTHSRLLDA